MSPANLNFTSLAANAVIPSSGNNYVVENLAFAHVLDNSNSLPVDGNPVLAWSQNSPQTSNQVWTYLTYPSSSGDSVFTLQALSTVQSGNSVDVIGGRGGYLRLDPSTNKVVHGGQPQAWKLVEIAPTIYKISPFEDIMSNSGKLVATDINPTTQSISQNQLVIQQDVSSLQQLWTFN
ncbi:uncharacterized protein FOMMEDRAFT_149461 [Fomitiporia mediterranea MF3/22]|uniref:uncharacterized protein n=1 Tax=Fomitiporia mediterranea (strain MF3/22) TaxID=694068 RepID=UPI00044086FA|nr:uncharacterized protein FOMMEDRAFT_149461 [Fomitiporia mediterranea MF3/22]EJC98024.1 hypothetical protein FOMMEDRAFT_149461 [Fomitiporia mediterranea MF3/22]